MLALCCMQQGCSIACQARRLCAIERQQTWVSADTAGFCGLSAVGVGLLRPERWGRVVMVVLAGLSRRRGLLQLLPRVAAGSSAAVGGSVRAACLGVAACYLATRSFVCGGVGGAAGARHTARTG